MEVSAMLILTVGIWSCAGFPVYDYDPGMLKEALRASVEKVNSKSQGPNLFRAYKSSIKRVNFVNENDLSMHIDFRIRETECRKESGRPPNTCNFKRGYYVPTASCTSTVEISAEQVHNVWIRCHQAFSNSDSSSSEEIFGGRLRSNNWRSYYLRDVASDESRSEPFYQRSLSIRDTEVFPPRSRRRQNHWNRYDDFE